MSARAKLTPVRYCILLSLQYWLNSMTEAAPKFSLIVATIGRTAQLIRLFETLKLQTCQSFEVIVVDQNPPGYLAKILVSFEGAFPIRYFRSEIGLSRGRNIGLNHIRGEFVCFPDDDCWYPKDLLESVANAMANHPAWDGLTGLLAAPGDPKGFRSFHRTSGKLTPFNLWRRSTSVTIFLRRTVVDRIGGFDEGLGRGARTGMTAAEECEYLIRALMMGFYLFYLPDVCVFHRPWRSFDETQMGRVFGDRKAVGYILRKHGVAPWFFLYRLIRSICGMVLYLGSGNGVRARFYWLASRGLVSGWLLPRQPLDTPAETVSKLDPMDLDLISPRQRH